jgi:DNA polymerase III epsilon subunit-like protein
MLTPTEQCFIYANLLTKCHSSARLQTQGYAMPAFREGVKGKWKKASITRSQFWPTPVPSPATQYLKRRAVVIDCEMVEVNRGRREVALLSAVDFLTGEVLINHYVQPTAKVTNWTTKISGVTPAAMTEAVSKGQALQGWQSARQALFNYVDAHTILIGHSLNHDLDVLGIYHTMIVDSAILASEAVFGSTSVFKRLYSLKTLSEEFVKLRIQPDNHAHVCLEDTFATRDVVLSFLRNPGGLEIWAAGAKTEYDAQQKRREAERRQKRDEKAKAAAEPLPAKSAKLPLMRVVDHLSDSDDYGYEYDSETPRWSDIAEDCGWPHPDTGYDPWSD